MCETVTCWGNPDLVSCKNPGKLVDWVNPGILVNWGNPGKLVILKNHCYKPRTNDGLHVNLSGEPWRISKLGEKTVETQENWLYEGNRNVCGTATCRGNPEELVSWGNPGKLVNWGNPGKLVNLENPEKTG